MICKEILNYIFRHVDIISCILGITLGTAILLLSFTLGIHQHVLGIVILSASCLYLILKSWRSSSLLSEVKGSSRWIICLQISFMTIFSYVIFVLHNSIYYRPLILFILIPILAGLVALQILNADSKNYWMIFIGILLLSLAIRAGIYYNFPSLMGYDQYAHANIIEQVTLLGAVPSFDIAGKYCLYPLFHIFVSTFQTIAGTSIKDSIFLSIGLVNIIISILFFILFGNILGRPKLGLLVALIFNVTNYSIEAGLTNVTPGSLAICYFFVILYVVLSSNDRNVTILCGLSTVMIFAIILTHQLSGFVIYICLLSMYASRIYWNTFSEHHRRTGFTLILLIFTVTMTYYWIITPMYEGTSFFESSLSPIIHTLTSEENYFGVEVAVSGAYDNLSYILAEIGYYLLLFFAIGGVYCWSNTRIYQHLSIVFPAIFLFMLIYGSSAIGIRTILPGRWYFIFTIFLSMLAAVYVLWILSKIKSGIFAQAVLFSMIGVLTFFMISAPFINDDNPIYAKEKTVRSQFTSSEIQALNKINNVYTGLLRTDFSYSGCLFRQYAVIPEVSPFDTAYIEEPIHDEDGTMILIRNALDREYVNVKYNASGPIFRHSYMSYKVPIAFKSKFESENYDKIYSNKEVTAFYSIKSSPIIT